MHISQSGHSSYVNLHTKAANMYTQCYDILKYVHMCTSKFKKLLISKWRIGILKKLPKQGVKIVRVCDFIII